jgi:hypothetical protein
MLPRGTVMLRREGLVALWSGKGKKKGVRAGALVSGETVTPCPVDCRRWLHLHAGATSSSVSSQVQRETVVVDEPTVDGDCAAASVGLGFKLAVGAGDVGIARSVWPGWRDLSVSAEHARQAPLLSFSSLSIPMEGKFRARKSHVAGCF